LFTLINTTQVVELVYVTEKLHEVIEKNPKKEIVELKKVLPLHRF